MAQFHFELVSPEKLLFSGDVEAVVVPGSEGQFTVLKDHAPVVTTLRPGFVEIEEAANKKTRLFVSGGFADVAGAGLTIIADKAIAPEQFDVASLAAEIKNAEEDLADATAEDAKNAAAQKLEQLKELLSAFNA